MFRTEDFIMPLLIFFVISIVVFLIIRALVLWYYKIDERVKLLETNNEILLKIYNQLTGEVEKEETVIKKKVLAPGELSDANKRTLEVFKSYGLKKGERVALHIDSKEVSKMSKSEWESIVAYGKADEWKILHIEE